jgi:hypothetical protein
MMTRIVVALSLALLLAGCGGYVLTLKDGRSIETKAAPELDSKTNFYKVETKSGDKLQINKDEVLMIKQR